MITDMLDIFMPELSTIYFKGRGHLGFGRTYLARLSLCGLRNSLKIQSSMPQGRTLTLSTRAAECAAITPAYS